MKPRRAHAQPPAPSAASGSPSAEPAPRASFRAPQRRQRVLELRKAGMGESQIAQILSLQPATVRGDLKHMLALTVETARSEQRGLDIERVDMALLGIAQDVRRGDHKAIDRWVRLCEQRRRLLTTSTRGSKPEPAPLQIKVVAAIDLEKV